MPGVVHPINSSGRVNAEAVAMAHWQARAQVFAVAAWVAVQPAHDLGLGTELWSESAGPLCVVLLALLLALVAFCRANL